MESPDSDKEKLKGMYIHVCVFIRIYYVSYTNLTGWFV